MKRIVVVLGLACMTLEIPMDGALGEGSVMLPMLTGLFGIPVLLESSSSSRMPEQRDRIADPVGMVPGLKGVLMGTVAGWFPGITSTVGASMSAAVFPEDRPERFMISMTPIHRQSTPAMARHRSTAAPAPSSAAAPTAAPLPVASPHRMEMTTIPVQIAAIAMPSAPFSFLISRSGYLYDPASEKIPNSTAKIGR